jgi:hypothetical protein
MKKALISQGLSQRFSILLVPLAGIELATFSLRMNCSAN